MLLSLLSRDQVASACSLSYGYNNDKNNHIGLQLDVLRHLPHRLSHPEVAQNVFGATKDRVEWNSPVIVLNEMTHSCAGDSASTKDLDSICRSLLSGLCAVHLQQTDGTGELRGLFLV